MSLGTLGVTFGTTQGHQKGPLGPPWRTSFETRHRKHLKKVTFGGLVLGPKFDDIYCLFVALVFTCAPSEENEVKMSQNVQKKNA